MTAEFFAGSKGNALRKLGCTIAFWWSDEKGLPCNGGSDIEAANEGVIHTVCGEPRLYSNTVLHATLDPSEWKGKRLWLVAMYPPVIKDVRKLGSQRREIISEVSPEYTRSLLCQQSS